MSNQQKKNEKRMTRSEVTELYKDVHSAMKQIKGAKEGENSGASENLQEKDSRFDHRKLNTTSDIGQKTAIGFVILLVALRLGISGLEYSGLAKSSNANATMKNITAVQPAPAYPKESIEILSALDARRTELDVRATKLEERAEDLDARDREFSVKIAQLRELTQKLKMERDLNQKKRGLQIDQLANVYGSMEPSEAAKLIDQLDITISLDLLKRMPEKRIAQILSLMSPERALTVTRMLSTAN